MPAIISGHVFLFSKVSFEGSSVWHFNSNKRKTAVEKHGGKRDKRVVLEQKNKKNPVAHKVTGFFDV